MCRCSASWSPASSPTGRRHDRAAGEAARGDALVRRRQRHRRGGGGGRRPSASARTAAGARPGGRARGVRGRPVMGLRSLARARRRAAMTRVAALYDIHANLPALDAVLAEADAADLVVVGGDFAHGPLPAETVDRLRGLGDRVRFIRGNADREVAGDDAWQRGPLGPERLEFLAGLPETLTLDVEGLGSVLFCHGSPRSDEEIMTVVTPDDRLGRIP